MSEVRKLAYALIACCNEHAADIPPSVLPHLRALWNALAAMEQPDTLGADEPHPGGTPHDRWVEYECKVQAEAAGRFDVV